jgi:hypothetical protein
MYYIYLVPVMLRQRIQRKVKMPQCRGTDLNDSVFIFSDERIGGRKSAGTQVAYKRGKCKA